MIGPIRLDLKGSSEEIGLQHGRQLKDQIRSQIEIYANMFEHCSHMTWPEVIEVAKEFEKTILKSTPHLHEEIKNIALGAEVDFYDIIALNCRSEIALGCFADGCTALSWKMDDNAQYLAQNWDWVPAVKPNLVAMTIEQTNKPKIYMITEAGLVGKIGYNDEGVGLCFNTIRARPMHTDKLPIHLVLRICLESRSAVDAIGSIERLAGVASAQHVLIADARGATGLELSPKDHAFLTPKYPSHALVHTNHFIENTSVDEPPFFKCSPVRLKRTYEIIEQLEVERENQVTTANISPSILRDRIFADSFNEPGSICRQLNPAAAESERTETLFNIVMLFRKGFRPLVEVLWGKPGKDLETNALFNF